jgi:asparagine synthase (glutamine-hydrolysing)
MVGFGVGLRGLAVQRPALCGTYRGQGEMSGIAGVWMMDGDPAARQRLAVMLEVMAHRGPDGCTAWAEGGVAVGHAKLRSTPESESEVLPLRAPDQCIVLTSDARIDNRRELIGRLGLGAGERADLADSELILAAYRRWGGDCPGQLLGDFAFAIWDGERRQMFCARDHFGVRPFHYHYAAGNCFAFSSELKGLETLPGVADEINESWIARYLSLGGEELTNTVYEKILRLPPAHTLTVSRDRAVLNRYWSLDPEHEVRRRSSAAYEEEFRAIFFEAVRCRTRSATPVASTLSGGLDSSSIACVAAEVLRQERRDPLHAISLVFDDTPESDERPYIQAVLAGGAMVPHFVGMSAIAPVEAACAFGPALDGPMSTANAALDFGLASAARQAGCKVLLDGFFGDDAISHGQENFATLMRERKYYQAAVSGLQYSRNHREPLGWVLRRLLLGPVTPAPVLRAWSGIRRHTRRRPTRSIIGLYESLISTDFRARLRELRREDEYPARDPARPQATRRHYDAFVNPFTTIALETDDLVAAAYGIEKRYPFLDLRLIRFAYGLPSAEKVRGGWSRSILRRSLSATVPAMVSWRTDKGDLSHWLMHAVSGADSDRLRRMIEENGEEMRPYVDLDRLRETLDDAIAHRCSIRFVAAWQSLSLGLWLRSRRSGSERQTLGDEGSALPIVPVNLPPVVRPVEAFHTSS